MAFILKKKGLFVSSLIVIVIGCLWYACIEPYEINSKTVDKVLVVDGAITNQTSANELRIFYSARFAREAIIETVSDANVTLYDNEGNSWPFLFSENACYETPENFRGKPDNSYYIEIVTTDGRKYRSEPEIMQKPVDIDKITYEYTQKQQVNDAGNIVTIDGYQVYLSVKDPENDQNFYRWKWKGTFEIITDWITNGIPHDSLPSAKCCRECWISEYMKSDVNISDDTYFAGGKLECHPVQFIPWGIRFNCGKYHIALEQHSISKKAYNFWRQIDGQISFSGFVDETPAYVRGNIRNIDNPDELVLGWFGAYAVSKKSIFVYSSELGSYAYRYIGDCRDRKNSTAIKPDFWID